MDVYLPGRWRRVEWSREREFPAKGIACSERRVDLNEAGVFVNCTRMDMIGAQEAAPLLSLVTVSNAPSSYWSEIFCAL